MLNKLATVVAVSLVLTACGKDATKPEIVQPPESKMDQMNGAAGQGVGVNNGNNPNALGQAGHNAQMDHAQGTMTDGMMDPFSDPANPLSQSVIYFDYNSAQVRDIDVVNAHARYLADNPYARVRLEGHADERGSREFNVALSEDRSNAVQRLMSFQGVRNSQANIVSFGEERPKAFGNGEQSWQENRRVEIIYESK